MNKQCTNGKAGLSKSMENSREFPRKEVVAGEWGQYGSS